MRTETVKISIRTALIASRRMHQMHPCYGYGLGLPRYIKYDEWKRWTRGGVRNLFTSADWFTDGKIEWSSVGTTQIRWILDDNSAHARRRSKSKPFARGRHFTRRTNIVIIELSIPPRCPSAHLLLVGDAQAQKLNKVGPHVVCYTFCLCFFSINLNINIC